jgi:hypothetical protein
VVGIEQCRTVSNRLVGAERCHEVSTRCQCWSVLVTVVLF